MTRWLPKFEWARWDGDGLHNGCDAPGRCVSFAWLGFYVEFVVGVERRR